MRKFILGASVALAAAAGPAAAQGLPTQSRIESAVGPVDPPHGGAPLPTSRALMYALVLTSSQNPRALPPPTLQSLATQLGGPASEIVPAPHRALARGRELAGHGGVVIATGSIYLIADLLAPAQRERASVL